MSSHQSYSYSSSSSSYSSTTGGGTNAHAYSEETHTDPSGTTTTRTVYKEPGRPAVAQTTSHASGARLSAGGQTSTQGRIEDVSDREAEKRYEESIEDEYAKREGGA